MSDVITTVEQQTIVVDSGSTAVIETKTANVVVANGDAGPQGIPGPAGINGTNGAQGPPGTSDKTFTQTFGVATSVTVTHNLGKYPAVTVIDSANDEVEGFTEHTSINQLTLTFSAPFSGTVFCN